MKCRSCHSEKIIDAISLGEQYLSDFIDTDVKPAKYPLDLVLCTNCSLVQMKTTTPPRALYTSSYGYRSGINNTMKGHLRGIVDKARTMVSLNMEDVVVDIGSNDATLLKNYPQEVIRIGFDPIAKWKKFYTGTNLVFANYFFNADIYGQILTGIHEGKKAKIITAISMFYDLDDPNTFLENIVKILHEDGVFIIQQNYLVDMLQNNAFDNIVHEHLEYYSLTSLEKLLTRHGLEVFDVELNDLNGGSIRTYIRHMNPVRKLRLYEQKLHLNSKFTYMLFEMKLKKIRKELYTFVKKQVDEGKKVYIMGASTRGNTLLQYFGLDKKLITAAIERNEDKFGKKIASVGIPIISEEEANKAKIDYALVLPWFFWDEMKERYKPLSDRGVKFIIPLPEFRIE